MRIKQIKRKVKELKQVKKNPRKMICMIKQWLRQEAYSAEAKRA
jgi:hypothetical protein